MTSCATASSPLSPSSLVLPPLWAPATWAWLLPPMPTPGLLWRPARASPPPSPWVSSGGGGGGAGAADSMAHSLGGARPCKAPPAPSMHPCTAAVTSAWPGWVSSNQLSSPQHPPTPPLLVRSLPLRRCDGLPAVRPGPAQPVHHHRHLPPRELRSLLLLCRSSLCLMVCSPGLQSPES